MCCEIALTSKDMLEGAKFKKIASVSVSKMVFVMWTMYFSQYLIKCIIFPKNNAFVK